MASSTGRPDEPATPAPKGFHWQTITPHVPRFEFRVLMPDDFQVVPLPEESPDFSDTAQMLPLGVAMAKYAAVVFTVATRPAFSAGTVADWLVHMARTQEGLQLEEIGESRVGDIPCVACFATQQSEAGPMRMRTSLFEDGGMLFNVSVMAPQALWGSVEATFVTMVNSFTLSHREGSRVPLAPAQPPAAATAEADPSESYATYALASDTGSLDPEHQLNAYFRDNGIGLVPRVLAKDDAARSVTLGAGAILATFRVPFGWHVIDDGKRTLVFDAGNDVQINLNLFDPEGSSDADVIESLLAQAQQHYPGVEHVKLELAGMKCLGLRNLEEGGERLQQAYLIRAKAPRDLMLQTRVPARDAGDHMTRAMDVAGLIHRDLVFPEA